MTTIELIDKEIARLTKIINLVPTKDGMRASKKIAELIKEKGKLSK